jgi:hypothetical protein
MDQKRAKKTAIANVSGRLSRAKPLRNGKAFKLASP